MYLRSHLIAGPSSGQVAAPGARGDEVANPEYVLGVQCVAVRSARGRASAGCEHLHLRNRILLYFFLVKSVRLTVQPSAAGLRPGKDNSFFLCERTFRLKLTGRTGKVAVSVAVLKDRKPEARGLSLTSKHIKKPMQETLLEPANVVSYCHLAFSNGHDDPSPQPEFLRDGVLRRIVPHNQTQLFPHPLLS